MTRYLLIATLLTGLWLLRPHPAPRSYDYDWPGKQRVVERLAYHGIWGAQPDGNGWYFFMRDGKRCRL